MHRQTRDLPLPGPARRQRDAQKGTWRAARTGEGRRPPPGASASWRAGGGRRHAAIGGRVRKRRRAVTAWPAGPCR